MPSFKRYVSHLLPEQPPSPPLLHPLEPGPNETNPPHLQFFDDPKTHLVHDPNNSLRLGDVVAITPGWRVSKSKRHVVKHIIAPGSGVPIEVRPPIPTEEERYAELEADRLAKLERRGINKLAERAEKQVGLAELILRKARKEVALRTRLMGIGAAEGKEGGDAAAGPPQ